MADTPLARVGDVITHGEAIPGNVLALRDRSDDIWRTNDDGTWDCSSETGEPYGRTYSGWPLKRLHEVFKTLRVVEVDPEPQPAERPRCTNGPDCQRHPEADPEYTHEVDGTRMHHLGAGRMAPDTKTSLAERNHAARLAAGCCGMVAVHLADCPKFDEEQLRASLERYLPEQPADPGPIVLSLPQVPDEATLRGALTKRLFHSFLGGWESGDGNDDEGATYRLGELLDMEGSVTVEMAPPREPRTWPKLDDEPDAPDMVEVEGQGRFVVAVRRSGEGFNQTTYLHEDDEATGGVTWTLGRLRELGEVREVLT